MLCSGRFKEFAADDWPCSARSLLASEATKIDVWEMGAIRSVIKSDGVLNLILDCRGANESSPMSAGGRETHNAMSEFEATKGVVYFIYAAYLDYQDRLSHGYRNSPAPS